MLSRIGQAARILSGFHFNPDGYCHIIVGFVDRDGSVNAFSADKIGEECVRKWRAKEWRGRISELAGKLTRNGHWVTSVKSIEIVFRPSSDPNGPLYVIEATDLPSGGLNKLRLPHTSGQRWGYVRVVYLTARERAHIHGVCDVVKLAKEIPRSRIKEEKVQI